MNVDTLNLHQNRNDRVRMHDSTACTIIPHLSYQASSIHIEKFVLRFVVKDTHSFVFLKDYGEI